MLLSQAARQELFHTMHVQDNLCGAARNYGIRILLFSATLNVDFSRDFMTGSGRIWS